MPRASVKDENTKDAVGSRSNPERFLGQNYEELQQDFLQNKARFIDDKFPPDATSIGDGLLSEEMMAKVEWIRPTKMVSDPHLVVEGESRFDLAQGSLGDCWFLAAIGAITFQPHIIEEIIPVGQSFTRGYAGIFHFRFWRFGRWVDVVVDDKLPTIDGHFIFVHCKTRNEFWPALLEKAYAKVCGSYADLQGGLISEALRDFTGGVYITLRLNTHRPENWGLLHRAAKYRSWMGCGSYQGATSENTELPNGIVEGHAYTVTAVTKVKSEGEPVKLVRVLNPWGRKEWIGDWSDRSPLWESVPSEERSHLLQKKDDGEFWMSMEDFCTNFAIVDICCQTPAFLDGSSESSWTTKMYEGRWDENTAGGSRAYRQSFWMNPQYRLMIPAITTDTGEALGLNLMVSLLQKPNSRHRKHVENLHIGFNVFAVPLQLKDQTNFPAHFFSSNTPVAQSKIQSNTREVMEFLRLKPGYYVIVPFTEKPKQTASFILTVHLKIKPR